MRVLFLYYAEFYLEGGVQSMVLGLAKGLAARGVAATIVDFAGDPRPEQVFDGVPVRTISGPIFPTWRELRSWEWYARSLRDFERVCWEYKPDIVHVHFPWEQCPLVVGACALPHRWQVVATVHGSDIRVLGYAHRHVRFWQDRLFRRTRAVTAASRGLLEDTIRLYPHVSPKAQVIYNGVDRAWFEVGRPNGNTSARFALFVGRLHPVKALDVLLHAWKLAGPRCPGLQLWIAGDGQQREALTTLARNLGVNSSVKFLGFKSPEELRSLYSTAELFVLPSRHEGFGVVLIEAGACGCIRIGTRIPGVTEVVADGETGFLVAPDSPEALAEGIVNAASMSNSDRQRMSRATRDEVLAKFRLETIVNQYFDLYRNLLESKVLPALSSVR